MTREEAIKIVQSATVWTDEERDALAMLIPEFAESEDEKNWKAVKEYIKDDALRSWLEKQKETGIRWLKSDNVKNPDKPYIDKAGMFYTTDGRMCYASEIEKQKEDEGYEAIPVESTLEYKLGFKAGKESEKQKEQKPWEWGEEETKLLDSIIDDYEAAAKSFCGYDGKIGLLRAIRDGEYDLPKQEWSEGDERKLQKCIKIVERWEEDYDIAYAPYSNTLKSLRSRPKQEWSDEDEKVLEAVDESLYCYESGKAPEVVAQIEAERLWLKSLPLNLKKKNEDVAKLCSNEWSEEDEAHRAFILESLEDQIRFCKKDAEGAYYVKQIRTAQNWLKSLKIS